MSNPLETEAITSPIDFQCEKVIRVVSECTSATNNLVITFSQLQQCGADMAYKKLGPSFEENLAVLSKSERILIRSTVNIVDWVSDVIGKDDPRTRVLKFVAHLAKDIAFQNISATERADPLWCPRYQSYTLCACCCLGDLFSDEPFKFAKLEVRAFDFDVCEKVWNDAGYSKETLDLLRRIKTDISNLRNSFVNHVYHGDASTWRGYHMAIPMYVLKSSPGKDGRNFNCREAEYTWLQHLTIGEGSLNLCFFMALALSHYLVLTNHHLLLIDDCPTDEHWFSFVNIWNSELQSLMIRHETPGNFVIVKSDSNTYKKSVLQSLQFRLGYLGVDLIKNWDAKRHIPHFERGVESVLESERERESYVMEFVIATCYRAVMHPGNPEDRDPPTPFIIGALPLTPRLHDIIFGSYIHTTSLMSKVELPRLSLFDTHFLLSELARALKFVQAEDELIELDLKTFGDPEPLYTELETLLESLLDDAWSCESKVKKGSWASKYVEYVSKMATSKPDSADHLRLKEGSRFVSSMRDQLSKLFNKEFVDGAEFYFTRSSIRDKRLPSEVMASMFVRHSTRITGTFKDPFHICPRLADWLDDAPELLKTMFRQALKNRVLDGPHDLLVWLISGRLTRGNMIERVIRDVDPVAIRAGINDMFTRFAPGIARPDVFKPLYIGTDLADAFSFLQTPTFVWDSAQSMGLFCSSISFELNLENACALARFKCAQNGRLLDAMSTDELASGLEMPSVARRTALVTPAVVQILVHRHVFADWWEIENRRKKTPATDSQFQDWVIFRYRGRPAISYSRWHVPRDHPLIEYSVKVDDKVDKDDKDRLDLETWVMPENHRGRIPFGVIDYAQRVEDRERTRADIMAVPKQFEDAVREDSRAVHVIQPTDESHDRKVLDILQNCPRAILPVPDAVLATADDATTATDADAAAAHS